MSLEDDLRAGTASQEDLQALAERVQDLEDSSQPDTPGFAAKYTINSFGEVTPIEPELEEEEGGPEAEGDLFYSGKSKNKLKRLAKGKKGQILTVNAKGELEWVEPAAGLAIVTGEQLFAPGAEWEQLVLTIAHGLGRKPKAGWVVPIAGHENHGVISGRVFNFGLAGGTEMEIEAIASAKQAKANITLGWAVIG